MSRTRTIIGIGEAILVRDVDRELPGGTAVTVASVAHQLGHRGIPISRVGQDQYGDRILDWLRRQSVELSSVQTDPDHATGRLTIRRIGGRTRRTFDTFAAFDNLQWDYDLEDLAQQADAVIYSALGMRSGQARSVIDRFLAECRDGLRICSLVAQLEDPLDRTALHDGLQYAQILIVDDAALRELLPSHRPESMEETTASLLKRHALDAVVHIDKTGTLQAVEAAGVITCSDVLPPEADRHATWTGLAHGLIHGWDWNRSLQAAARIGVFTAENPEKPLPADLLDAS